jgi:alanine dehydrogenase
MRTETLLLCRSDVEELLSLKECIDAVEEVFRLQGQGKVPMPGILGIKAARGGLHVKAGLLPRGENYIVAKLNTNFPNNRAQLALPTIQGLIVVCAADNGTALAVLDSIDITLKRTAAATAVAAKYLAREDSAIATICGCGQQARAQVDALRLVLPINKLHVFDLDIQAAKDFAADLGTDPDLVVELVRDLPEAIQKSDLCITCTTSCEFFVHKKDVSAGTFIAAIGADDERKQEIQPELIASAKVVADSLEQSCAIGDTHHAIAQGLMRKDDVYAELSEVVSGRKPGRTANDEIIIFDSTGVAIEDAVAATAVYEKARAAHSGALCNFAA